GRALLGQGLARRVPPALDVTLGGLLGRRRVEVQGRERTRVAEEGLEPVDLHPIPPRLPPRSWRCPTAPPRHGVPSRKRRIAGTRHPCGGIGCDLHTEYPPTEAGLSPRAGKAPPRGIHLQA